MTIWRIGTIWRMGIFSAALLFILGVTGCNERQQQMLERLMATQGSQYEGEEISQEKVEELERHVRLFSEEVVELVERKGELGVYYRMLAMEYLDEEMYGPALETFDKALHIYPNNHLLHYYAGVATSQIAETEGEGVKRVEQLRRAAHFYERAIELKGTYVDALYALSVLYIFELDRPFEAEPYVQKIIDIRSGHYRAKFLLARIRVEQNRIEEAVEIYTEIAEEAPQQEMVDKALENRERIMGGGYGN